MMRTLELVPAGGNYRHVTRAIAQHDIDTSHFTGQAWNKGLRFQPSPARPLAEVLVAGRWTSSRDLKQRLFRAGLKQPACELCGWAQRASDGRIPVELDHINGDHDDNRLENLRILCPNCHALQPTHRGLNKRSRRSR
ncbi:MAG TPA: HNH endonuclease [Kofleriaceae bacterium]|nr:HNH endonuclease [Kofleriaceae bacterium]